MRSVLIMGDRRMHWVTGHPPLATSPIIYGGVDLMRNAIEKMLETVRSVSSPTLWSSRLESEDKYCWNEPLGNSHQGVLRWEIKKTPVDGMNKVRYCLKNRRAIGRIVLPRMEDQLVARLLLGGFQSCQDRWRSDSRFNGDFFNKLMYEYHRKIFFKTPSTGVLSETHWDNSKAGLWTTDEFQQIIAKRNEVDAGDGDEIRYCKTSLRQVFALITQAFEPLLPNRDGCLRLSHAVPDVVVFDDLGLQVGKLKFSLPKKESCPVSSPIAFFNTDGMKYFEHVLCEYLAHLRFDEVGRYEDFLALYKSRACLTEHALQFVVARLYALANSVAERGDQCPAEPALVLSAADTIPELSDGKPESGEMTFWQHIYANEALRRRSIVLFDALTIRKEITISSGLSWERTAQDTIVEFKRSAKLRPFLKFGHVVIRFGLTGALLISNDRDSTWNYTLYFNPDQDDVTWTHTEDGVVLGATSVIAASIVQTLNDRCNWRQGRALLADLPHILDEALQLSVQRLITNFEIGMGTTDAEVNERLRRKKWFDTKTFLSRAEVMKADASDKSPFTRVGGQRVKLLPFRSRFWSILAQSCQTNLNNVARNIVYHGDKIVLNTIENPAADFAWLWLDRALERLENNSLSYNRQCSLFLDASDKKRYFTPQKPDEEEVAEELKNSLVYTLCDENVQGIRRLVGDSLGRSLTQLRDVLERSDTDTVSQLLLELTQQLAQRTSLFDKQLLTLAATCAEAIWKTLPPDYDQLIARLREHAEMRGHNADFTYLHLLQGRQAFLDCFCRIHKNHRVTTPDEHVHRAYGQLRDAFQGGVIQFDDDLYNSRVLDLTHDIDRELLATPRVFLHRQLVKLIRSREPFEGWTSPVSTPILRLGPPPKSGEPDKRLTVIDRKEVESIRAVKRMIGQYLFDARPRETHENDKDGRPERPLSIAVFGPPGSGKSVAVKKIIKMMPTSGAATKEFTVNLSQLTTVDELYDQLQTIKNESTNKVPVVFFDEFDSSLDEPLGWLRHFLAIMEDGRFRDIEIKNAIFVFAGGISSTFEEFSLANLSRNDRQWAEFSAVKGPDFVSRLKGHINMVGINPASADDDLYLIRRALALRFQLALKQNLSDTEVARIDSNLLSAFLHVPVYIHGARSMRMLVELCAHPDHNTMSMSQVPPIHQLNMQVDGQAFAALASGQNRPVFDEDEEPRQ